MLLFFLRLLYVCSKLAKSGETLDRKQLTGSGLLPEKKQLGIRISQEYLSVSYLTVSVNRAFRIMDFYSL